MYSAYKLNNQGDNMQPWRIPFPVWNQLAFPCPVLTAASWPAYRFLRKEVRLSGIPISFRIFHSLLWSTWVKGFSAVNEAEVYTFLEFPCFYYDPMDFVTLISGSSAFSKSSLYIWMSSFYVLLKPSLKDFECYFASMWNEDNSVVAWTFFVIAFLWYRKENWPFPVL